MSTWMNFVHSVERFPPTLTIQVVALKENGVVAETPDIDTAVSHGLELDALAYVRSRLLRGRVALHVGQGANAEAVLARRVEEAIDDNGWVCGADFENVADLEVRFEVVNRTPVVGH